MSDPAADLLDALVERVVERVRQEPPSVGYVSKHALAEDLGVKERTVAPGGRRGFLVWVSGRR